MRGVRNDGRKQVREFPHEGFMRIPDYLKTDNQKARWILRKLNIRVELDEETGCWLWPLAVSVGATNLGYGKVRWDGNARCAHRWLLEQLIGKKIPRKMHVDHAKWAGCTNKHCVKPGHLEVVTAAENIRRANWNGRFRRLWDYGAWCDEGHPFNNDNTFFVYDREHGVNFRHCKTCEPLRWKRIEKKRAEKQSARKHQYEKAA